jgi:hypothetical protein
MRVCGVKIFYQENIGFLVIFGQIWPHSPQKGRPSRRPQASMNGAEAQETEGEEAC